MTQATDATAVLHCANHPDRETLLRCNRCDKPICYECSVRTPVGMRCPECVRQQQDKYYNAAPFDVPIAGAVALTLGTVVGALAYAFLGAIGWFSFIIAFIAGPAAGGGIAEVIRRLLQKRRARGMKVTATIACIVGILLGGFLLVALPAMASGISFGTLLAALPRILFRLDVLLFGILAASTVYARLL
jgi:hypothetical protein